MEKSVVLMRVSGDVRGWFAEAFYRIRDVDHIAVVRQQCPDGAHNANLPLVVDLDRFGGLSTLPAQLRSAGFVGRIIALTNRPRATRKEPPYDEHEDFEIAFLASGGDRLVRSPYSPRLVGEIAEAMRRCASDRSAHEPQSTMLRFESGGVAIRIDEDRNRVFVNETLIDFTHGEILILRCLARRPIGMVITRAVLRDELNCMNSLDRSIDSRIKRIRQKVRTVVADSPIIETVRGLGYRTIA